MRNLTMEERDREWEFHLRSLSSSARDSNYATDPASDPSVLNSAILQVFLDFGDVILHDADPCLRTFSRSCLSREFADPLVAEKTIEFFNSNKGKLLKSFPTLLPQVERSSGSLVGSSIASIQKSAAPEMLLTLMDEAYIGSTMGDGGADSESEDSTNMTIDHIFLDLLKDDNDGLSEHHWTSPAMAAALQAVINTPRLLDSYFPSAVHDANDCRGRSLY